MLHKLTSTAYHIAPWKAAVLIDPHIPSIRLIIEIVQQMIGNINSLHILHIDAAQVSSSSTGIKFVGVQVFHKVDKVGHAGGVFAAVNHRLKLLQIAFVQFREQMGQMVELVNAFIFPRQALSSGSLPS